MTVRRTVLHCLTLLGAALILGGFLASSAVAAPLCAGVLLQVIPAAVIEGKIAELAKMKLALDLEHSQGEFAGELVYMDHLFSQTLTEVEQALRAQLSPQEIHNLISKEIRTLQNRNQKEAKTEQTAREQLRDLLPVYIRKHHIVLDRQVFYNHVFEYLPEHNVVIYQENNKYEILKRDLTTGQEVSLSKGNKRVHVLPDRKTLLFASADGEFTLVDVVTGIPTPLQRPPTGNRMYTAVDSTGEVLFASSDGSLLLYNLKKETSEVFSDVGNTSPQPISQRKVILEAYGRAPVLFDADTGGKQTIGNTDRNFSKFAFVSDDGKQMGFEVDNVGLQIYNVDNPTVVVQTLKRKLPKDEHIISYHKQPNSELLMGVKSVPRSASKTYNLYSLGDLNKPVFEFSEYQETADYVQRIGAFRTTPDRKAMAFIVEKNDQEGDLIDNTIDIWERQP